MFSICTLKLHVDRQTASIICNICNTPHSEKGLAQSRHSFFFILYFFIDFLRVSHHASQFCSPPSSPHSLPSSLPHSHKRKQIKANKQENKKKLKNKTENITVEKSLCFPFLPASPAPLHPPWRHWRLQGAM